MRRRRDGFGGWTARLAASLLLVQSVLLAFSLGATAEPVRRDQFGNVICASGADGTHGTPRGESHHSNVLECCTAACGMFGGPVAPPPAPFLPVAPVPAALGMPFEPYGTVGSGAPETSRTTRGPPFPIA